MAKKVYIGVSGAAQKIKKMYFGVSGVARKVKKAYIGVGGVARCFFSGGELAYYGTATALSNPMYQHGAASVGDYALFAGGIDANSKASSVVNAYNKSLTRTIPTALHTTKNLLAGANIGNYALFSGTSSTATIDAYNTSLTRSTSAAMGATGSVWPTASAATGVYALFCRGSVDAFNGSLTRTTPTGSAKYNSAGTNVGTYAVFAGGGGSPTTDAVRAWDSSLTYKTCANLNTWRGHMAGASVSGKYALFAGGEYVNQSGSNRGCYNNVTAYDTALTQSDAPVLDGAFIRLAGVGIGEYALFAGGATSATGDISYAALTPYGNAASYDLSLTKKAQSALSAARHGLVATTVADFAIFAGGRLNRNGALDAVDVYTVG